MSMFNSVKDQVVVGAKRYQVALKGDRSTQVLAATGVLTTVVGSLVVGGVAIKAIGAGIIVGSVIRGYQVTQVEEKKDEVLVPST